MGYWLKSYTDILNDPKYHRMSERAQLAMHEIFLVAKMIEKDEITGLVPGIEDIAFYSRKPVDYWEEAIPELIKVGIMKENGNGYIIVNYSKRQNAIPDDERARQYRKRKNNKLMSESSRNTNDLQTLRDGETDTYTDTYTEGELSAKNSAEPTYEPCTEDGEPIPKKKKRKKVADERSKHPAIISFRRLTGRYPPKINYDQVIEILGDEPDELKMKHCYQEWCSRGYKPVNIAWLLDWYVNGISKTPMKKNTGMDAVKAELARLEQEDG